MLFAVWVVIEQRVPEPLVDLATFARPEMAATNLTTLVVGFSMFSTFILLPNFVQIPLGLPPDIAAQIDYGFGASPVEVGLFFLPSSVAMMFAGPLAGALGNGFGNVLPLRVGIGFLVLSLVLLATVHDEPWTIYAWMVFMGIGLAFCFASLGALVIEYSPPGETGVASGMNTIMRTIGAALGAQVAAAIISATRSRGPTIPTESAFTTAFTLSAVGALRRAAADVPALAPASAPYWGRPEAQRRDPPAPHARRRRRGAARASRRAVLGAQGRRRLVDPQGRVRRRRGRARVRRARVRGGARDATAGRASCAELGTVEAAAAASRSRLRGRGRSRRRRASRSNTFTMEWPPRSGSHAGLPRGRSRRLVLASTRRARSSTPAQAELLVRLSAP